MRILKKGSTGDDVKQLQIRVGVTPDGIFGPRTEAAVKAFQSSQGLVADGIVGPLTHAKLDDDEDFNDDDSGPLDRGEPGDAPWVASARGEIGQLEIPGSRDNPRIVWYGSFVYPIVWDDETAWCAIFVCAMLESNGLPSTNSAWARDYLNYGDKLPGFIPGCIGVYERGTPGGTSHVAFVLRQEGSYDVILGGNQSNSVSIVKQPRSTLLGYRWPKGYPKKGTLPVPTPIKTPELIGHYGKLFETMQIRPEWLARANQATDRVCKHKARYEAVARSAGIPWYIVGVIHLMESGVSFATHLHNGDSLQRRTVRVPAGRPTKGSPPFTWEESAKDALAYDGIKGPLDSIEKQLSELEEYNGTGYRKRGMNSPYLWSGSQHWSKGKYVSDGKFDPNATSQQVGAALVIKLIKDRGLA